MGLLTRYEFVLLVSSLDLIFSVSRDSASWTPEGLVGAMQRVVVFTRTVFWGLTCAVPNLHCHTLRIGDRLEGSSSGFFRPDLIEHFTINWVMAKTLHLGTVFT